MKLMYLFIKLATFCWNEEPSARNNWTITLAKQWLAKFTRLKWYSGSKLNGLMDLYGLYFSKNSSKFFSKLFLEQSKIFVCLIVLEASFSCDNMIWQELFSFLFL